MSIENKICPYPGLRPFNEDESIFFKGRELHITQIIAQLAERKFLMLTGASGDGKSSLVYAGVVPNARAGFFKAKYNNWVVADFRPERSPLKNLAQSLCNALNITDYIHAHKELSYGFSALVDLYKESDCYLNQESDSYLKLDEKEKRAVKRKSYNLLIIADQFEEFFTNPENYTNGKPSVEAHTVINLLLETAKLALERDIPIYIICTMRSDYIGQCAAFRGLPEYIGFSQFFVPRLKRREIFQVIEEPALLNGDKVSKRLTETIINTLDEGIDQLPVLQHALNQIWQKAEHGATELDLIQFAKTGGLHKKYLNVNDRQHFEEWLETLPEFIKPFYQKPSLDNVLDTHANYLYEIAADEVNKKYSEPKITNNDAKIIIETTFKCLTKIDEGRPVRNRMTLLQVVNIINRQHLNLDVVAEVLDIFRKQGNTFLKPFINEQADILKPESILDITHESLIRNWANLKNWANEEYDDLQNFQDFNKQLQRWVLHKKSSDFLLPIGPLTFFEKWFIDFKPNKYWLAKYDERECSYEQKLVDADLTLKNANSLIKKSARRLIFSRTVLKYGADKLVAAFGLIVLLVSCTYFYFDYRKKQNDYVIKITEQKGNELLLSKFVSNNVKAEYIIAEERLHKNIYKDLLNSFKSDSLRLEVMKHMVKTCISFQMNKRELEKDNPLLQPIFIEQINLFNKNTQTLFGFSSNINNFIAIVFEHELLKRYHYELNEKETEKIYTEFCTNSFEKILALFQDTSVLKHTDIYQLNHLTHVFPFAIQFDINKLKQFISAITPFEPKNQIKFNLIYPKNKSVALDGNSHITHNGGYYNLADLYAFCGDFKNINKCFDSIVIYNQDFFNTFSYGSFLYSIIISNKFNTKETKFFIEKIKSKVNEDDKNLITKYILQNLISYGKIGGGKGITCNKLDDIEDLSEKSYTLQIQRDYIKKEQIDSFINYLINENNDDKHLSSDAKNYNTAILYKAKAFAYNNGLERKLNYKIIYDYFNKAIFYYKKISTSYLNRDTIIGRGITYKGKISDVFRYPYNIQFNYWNVYSFWHLDGNNDMYLFLNYLDSIGLLHSFYSDDDILSKYLVNISYFILQKMDKEPNFKPDIHIYLDVLSPEYHEKDKDAIYAYLTMYYNKIGKSQIAYEYAKKINFNQLFKESNVDNHNFNRFAYLTMAKNFANYFAVKIKDTIISKQENGIETKVHDLNPIFYSYLNSLCCEYVKRNSLIAAIDSLQFYGKDDIAIRLTDELINIYSKNSSQFSAILFEILGRFGSKDCKNIALSFLNNLNDNAKNDGLKLFIRGLLQTNNYYTAYINIPNNISSKNKLLLYTLILKYEASKSKTEGWSAMDNMENGMSFYEFSDNNGI